MSAKFIPFIAALLFITTVSAQKSNSEKYKKLEQLYEQEKYADCLFSAGKMMDNDKYSKDPQPYLYASMSYFGAYKHLENYPLKKYPEFKNPLKDAVSNFAKFRKYDKNGEVYAEHRAFADALKEALIDGTKAMYEKKDVMKLANLCRDITKGYDKDEVMLLLTGGYLLATQNYSEGLKNTDAAMAILNKDNLAEYGAIDQKGLAQGFMLYTDYLLSKKELTKAIDVITVAMKVLPSDESIKKQAEKISATSTK